MRRRIRLVAALGGIAVFAAACGGNSTADENTPTDQTAETDGGGGDTVPNSPDNGVTDNEIVLGWLGDLTGPTATATAVSLEGSQAYFDMVNADGGVLGRQVRIASLDDQFDAEKAVPNYQALVNDENVLALISMAGSHIGATLAPDISADGVPMIGPGQTTAPQLESPYIFHTLAHYADMADVLVQRMIEAVGGVENLRVVNYSLEVPSGEEFAGYITDKVEAAGGTIVGDISVAASGADYRTAAIQLQSMVDDQGGNYVAGLATAPNFLGLVTEMVDLGVDVPVAGMQAAVTPSIFQEGPEEMAETLVGFQSYMPCNVETEGTAVIRDLVEGTEAAENCLQPSWTLGWTNAAIAHQAMVRAGEESGELTRETLFEALQGTFDLDGVTCEVDWTESNYSPCGAPFRWTGEGFEPIEDFAYWEDALLTDGPGA